MANSHELQATPPAASTPVIPRASATLDIAGAEEPVAHRLDEVEDRIGVRDLLPRRGQAVHGVEDPAQERERQDDDVVDERVVVERLGVDPDDHPERAEQDERDRHRERQHERLVDRHPGHGQGERGQRGRDEQGADRPAERQAEVDLPVAHRGRQHVIQVPVEARLEDRAGVVRVRRLDHGHREQAGDDEHVVVHAVDLLDAPAQRQPEDDDEQERGDDGRDDRLRPQLGDAQHLAGRQPAAVPCSCRPSPSRRRRPARRPRERRAGPEACRGRPGARRGSARCPRTAPRPPRGSAWSEGSSSLRRAGGGCSATAPCAARSPRPPSARRGSPDGARA